MIWGGYGPDAQHSVFQWLLQGKGYSACDFIGIKEEKGISDSYKMLLAQITALTIGENDEDLKYRSIEGNNPTSLIQLNDLSPKCLGFLLACYEHKVFVEGIIYGINSFDQWLGHPAGTQYHYHIEPSFLTDNFGKDAFLGLLSDGFPVYGPEENGGTIISSNLDDYHGHTHETVDFPDGIYHYHITADAPYLNGNGFFGTAGTITR